MSAPRYLVVSVPRYLPTYIPAYIRNILKPRLLHKLLPKLKLTRREGGKKEKVATFLLLFPF